MAVSPAAKPMPPITENTVYEPVPLWAKLPHGLWMKEATSVAVDSQDRVYVFNRGNMPMLVFDPDGNLVDYWGNDDPYQGTELFEDSYGNMMPRAKGSWFMRPHGIFIDHDDNLWLTDDINCLMTKTDRKGNVLMRLGTGKPSAFQSGEPFNRPTDVAVHPHSGDLFVSDGYRNSRVHRYTADGRHIMSWGEPGSDEGQFSLPHDVCLVGDRHALVCDRENHRVQMFTLDGKFVRTWHSHKAVAATATPDGSAVVVAEQGPPPVQRNVPNVGHKIQIYTPEGDRLTKFGAALPGEHPDQFNWLHGLAIDSQGNIYGAEVSYVEVGSKLDPPRELVSLRKWRRAKG